MKTDQTKVFFRYDEIGRYILIPIPCILGAYTAIKLGYVLVEMF